MPPAQNYLPGRLDTWTEKRVLPGLSILNDIIVNMKAFTYSILLLLFCFAPVVEANGQNLRNDVDELATEIEEQVITWRRDFHENPELSNREYRTGTLIADFLEGLGIEVERNVAHTGVVGILRGANPGPVVALRADMDGLPVEETTLLPFASVARSEYNGEDVPVMHACGHDTHMAILMGVADSLVKLKDRLRGTVVFLFQPAEEGAPTGEEGGAELMVEEGVLERHGVDVVFGLHISSTEEVNTINYRPGGLLASVNSMNITVYGSQSHGAAPWMGVDPIVTSAQIIMGLQTIVSRNMELTKNAAVITIGKIEGGVRSNIIPEKVEMEGTIRALDPDMQSKLHERIREVATRIAESAGARAEVVIHDGYPVTYNDPYLVDQMLPSLKSTAGDQNVRLIDAVTGAEDFSFFAREVPGFFFFLGGRPLDVALEDAPSHHRPDFFVDESGMKLGVRTLTNMAIDYMEMSTRQ